MRYLYSLILYLAAPFFIFKLHKKRPGKPAVGKRWAEHFGFSKATNLTSPIWIHAVSVGEVIAAQPLIKELQTRYPQEQFLLTTTTPTGAEMAAKIENITHRYMPFDFSWAISRFVRQHQPKIMLIMETELWPNTLHFVNKAQIPIILANARLSNKSLLSYQKFSRLFNQSWSKIDKIICQYQHDADNFIELNYPLTHLSIVGSIKFDLEISKRTVSAGENLRERFGVRPVWIAASTHKGEDEQIIQAHRLLLDKIPNALLILVPRHPERFSEVTKLVAHNFSFSRRQEDEANLKTIQVYIGDTMGELLLMYAAADIAFIGGSLIGDKVGGHNLLEPAALGKPIITGPSFYNFKVIGDALIAENACQICNDSNELFKLIYELLSNENSYNASRKGAQIVMKNNQGALEKTIDIIDNFI